MILAIIPARSGSKRLPNKNILPIFGKPMIYYTIEMAKRSKLIDEIIVSTDSQDIIDCVKHNVMVIKRPKRISGDKAAIDDALRHVISRYEAINHKIDLVVLLQANCPIRQEGDIDLCLQEMIKDKSLTACVTAQEIEQRPEWMFTKDKKTDILKPREPQTTAYRTQDLPPLYMIDGAVQAHRVSILKATKDNKKAHAYFGSKIKAIIHEPIYSLEVHNQRDLELAEYYLKVLNINN